jgi:hypothetical protein
MPKQLTQDDNGNFFYLSAGKLYGFGTQQQAQLFKTKADRLVESFEDQRPVTIYGIPNPKLVEDTFTLSILIDELYRKLRKT